MVLPLESLFADMANVFSFITVGQFVLRDGTGIAEYLERRERDAYFTKQQQIQENCRF